MSKPLDELITGGNGMGLMTHTVAGFPDLAGSEEMVCNMASWGADLVEIQIPFTDPLADGPVIMRANQDALDKGTTPADCFSLVQRLRNRVNIPLLLMTYANIPFRMGMERFFDQAASCGASGLIIPDMPFDDDETSMVRLAAEYSLPVIWVVSPDMAAGRLKNILAVASGFVYVTLRVGTTGPRAELSRPGLDFLGTVKEHSEVPVAVGFGISTPEHLSRLSGRAEIAVVGSHIIKLVRNGGMDAVERFIKQCKIHSNTKEGRR
jgi:tryptophan synthase alpha chain